MLGAKSKLWKHKRRRSRRNEALQKLGAKQKSRKHKQDRFKANDVPERQGAKQYHEIALQDISKEMKTTKQTKRNTTQDFCI
jgi:hypothetical protein